MEELPPSALGTIAHWKDAYTAELRNFEESNGNDQGEVWFGTDEQEDIVEWLLRSLRADDAAADADADADADAAAAAAASSKRAIVDLGTGNAAFLITLAKADAASDSPLFNEVHGTDAVPEAVDLAKRVIESENLSDAVHVFVDDILDSTLKQNAYDVITDKGTYDAISLAENARPKREAYLRALSSALAGNARARFLLTSCNWTRDELEVQLKPHGFVVHDELKWPTFEFGGVAGARIRTLFFKRASLSVAASDE